MNYLLTVFVSHKRQEDFVMSLAQQVQTISTDSIKYFFGDQSILITFDTKLSLKKTTEFFNTILGDFTIPFVLAPTSKITYWFDKHNEKHLFDTDVCSNNTNPLDENFITPSDEPKRQIPDGLWGSAPSRRKSQHSHLFYDEEEIVEEIPTLDELLDKINVSGMKSLTDKEKELLNKYSK